MIFSSYWLESDSNFLREKILNEVLNIELQVQVPFGTSPVMQYRVREIDSPVQSKEKFSVIDYLIENEIAEMTPNDNLFIPKTSPKKIQDWILVVNFIDVL